MAAENAMKKWHRRPRKAVASPPSYARGPSKPLAIPCRRGIGLTPKKAYTMKDAAISRTPQASPPHKIASRARGGEGSAIDFEAMGVLFRRMSGLDEQATRAYCPILLICDQRIVLRGECSATRVERNEKGLFREPLKARLSHKIHDDFPGKFATLVYLRPQD